MLTLCPLFLTACVGGAPGCWYTFNDHQRKPTTFETMGKQGACILYYSRPHPRQHPAQAPFIGARSSNQEPLQAAFTRSRGSLLAATFSLQRQSLQQSAALMHTNLVSSECAAQLLSSDSLSGAGDISIETQPERPVSTQGSSNLRQMYELARSTSAACSALDHCQDEREQGSLSRHSTHAKMGSQLDNGLDCSSSCDAATGSWATKIHPNGKPHLCLNFNALVVLLSFTHACGLWQYVV